ncbi:MAG: hypothetical protein IJ264_00720 [Clostridia bacterium]|nr:hypothetical protein [Clostridia bacterium]
MGKKAFNIISVVCFTAFIIALGASFIFKEPVDVLVSERRKAAQLPDFSVNAVMDKSFFDGFEEYLMDQFPLREKFRAVKAAIELKLLGQKDSNGIFLAEGHISEIQPALNEKSVKNAAQKITAIHEKYLAGKNTRVFYSVIPDKNHYLAAQNGYPGFDFDRMTEILADNIKNMEYIDISDTLSLDSYYRTDTHWRQEAIEKTVERLSLHMGFKAESFQNYKAEKVDSFNGVYSSRLAFGAESDDLICLRSAVTDSANVYNAETKETLKGVYNFEKLSGNDKYDLFLSGATPVISIENPLAEEKKELVMFRDSFGSSLAPLILPGYSKITMVDTRYISSQVLGDFVNFENCDVLFIYNNQLLNQSSMLK